MFVIRNKKIFLLLSLASVLFSVASIFFKGIPVGIEFAGGSIIEIKYTREIADKAEVETLLSQDFSSYSLRSIGENGYALRMSELNQEGQRIALKALSLDDTVDISIERISDIGPTISGELQKKALYAILIVILVILLYVAFSFRKASKEVSAWSYGFATIISLMHDVIVPAGLFVWYSHFTHAEFDVLFIMASLAILGYSVNDTIVIFDRVRENLIKNEEDRNDEDFESVIGKSLTQSLARSINTSLTTGLVLGVLFFIGGISTQAFAFLLFMGVIAGSYSSICLATPLLAIFKRKVR